MRIALVPLLLVATVSVAKDSTQPTMWFPQPSADVVGRLANECANQSGSVVEQDAYHVLCSKRVSGLKGALTQALIGNSYSTTPEVKVRFAIFSSAGATRVQADQWVETQMAFGQMRREPLMNSKQVESLRAFMLRAGGQENQPQAPVTTAPPTP